MRFRIKGSNEETEYPTSSFKALHSLEPKLRVKATPYMGKQAAMVCIVSRYRMRRPSSDSDNGV